MIRIIITVLLVLACSLTKAQTTQLSFSPTTETGIDSATFNLGNMSADTLRLQMVFFDVYGQKPFWSNDSVVVIPPNTPNRPVKVYFRPQHNILNQSGLLLQHANGSASFYVKLTGQGLYSRTYWDTTRNLEGEALRAALHWRTGTPYTQLGYSGTNNARLRMFGIIDNWKVNGREPSQPEPYKNECVYTGRTITYPASAFNTGTLNNAPYQMNTEHTWPQSMGASSEPMLSDLNHLHVADGPVNSARGNKPFGWVPAPTLNYTGGSKANTTTFEPRDAHKAGVAAAMLYFSVRYMNQSNVTHTYMTQDMENDLREWLKVFPPDSILRKRNDDIQLYQQNRNPFIDYPQLLDRMSQVRATAAVPNFDSIYVSIDTVNFGTVTPGITRPFQVAVINNGNQTVQLNGIQFNGTGLSYNGPANFTLGRGEGALLPFQYTGSTQALFGNLQMTTTAASRPAINIPIVAGGGTSTLSNFGLWAPLDGLNYNIAGESNQLILFRWFRSFANPTAPINYTLQINTLESTPRLLLALSTTDTFAYLNYGALDRALNALNVNMGDIQACRWTVHASDGIQTLGATETREIGFRKGIVTSTSVLSEDHIKVYPNPSQGETHLSWPALNAQSSWELRDQSGRRLQLSGQLTDGQLTIDVQSLAAGLYFVYLTAAQDSRVVQLMVKK